MNSRSLCELLFCERFENGFIYFLGLRYLSREKWRKFTVINIRLSSHIMWSWKHTEKSHRFLALEDDMVEHSAS